MKASEFLKRFNSLVEVVGGDPEVLLSISDTILEQAAVETQWCKPLYRHSSDHPKLWTCDFDQDVDEPVQVIKIW